MHKLTPLTRLSRTVRAYRRAARLARHYRTAVLPICRDDYDAARTRAHAVGSHPADYDVARALEREYFRVRRLAERYGAACDRLADVYHVTRHLGA